MPRILEGGAYVYLSYNDAAIIRGRLLFDARSLLEEIAKNWRQTSFLESGTFFPCNCFLTKGKVHNFFKKDIPVSYDYYYYYYLYFKLVQNS